MNIYTNEKTSEQVERCTTIVTSVSKRGDPTSLRTIIKDFYKRLVKYSLNCIELTLQYETEHNNDKLEETVVCFFKKGKGSLYKFPYIHKTKEKDYDFLLQKDVISHLGRYLSDQGFMNGHKTRCRKGKTYVEKGTVFPSKEQLKLQALKDFEDIRKKVIILDYKEGEIKYEKLLYRNKEILLTGDTSKTITLKILEDFIEKYSDVDMTILEKLVESIKKDKKKFETSRFFSKITIMYEIEDLLDLVTKKYFDGDTDKTKYLPINLFLYDELFNKEGFNILITRLNKILFNK